MPMALKPLFLIHFWGWMNSPFPLLALWGNKNWPPNMKVKKLENFQNLKGAKGCKWSSLNSPGTENPLSHAFLEVRDFPFPNRHLPLDASARLRGEPTKYMIPN